MWYGYRNTEIAGTDGPGILSEPAFVLEQDRADCLAVCLVAGISSVALVLAGAAPWLVAAIRSTGGARRAGNAIGKNLGSMESGSG